MEEAWTGREEELRDVAAARETGGYGRLSLDLVDALHGDGHEVMILNVANRSSLPFLDEEAVVEVPVRRRPRRHRAGRDRRRPDGRRGAASSPSARPSGRRSTPRCRAPGRWPSRRSRSTRSSRRWRSPSRILDRHLAEQPGLAETLQMSVDVVCAGPPFLDLVFRGLARLPEPGEEVLANELAIVPGAMANVAFALRQLGARGGRLRPDRDGPGRPPAPGADGRGGHPVDRRAGVRAPPVSVGLPIDGERAFVTHFPMPHLDVAAIAALAPRAVVVNLPLPAGLSADGRPDARLIGVVGDPQVEILLNRHGESWSSLRAVVPERARGDAVVGPVRLRDCRPRRSPVGVASSSSPAVSAASSRRSPTARVMGRSRSPSIALDTVGAGDLFTAA